MNNKTLRSFAILTNWHQQSSLVKSLLLAFAITITCSHVSGQQFVERLVGGAQNTGHQFSGSTAKRAQQLYTPADLNNPATGGNVQRIYFMNHSTTAQNFTDMEVYIGQTAATELGTDMNMNFSDAAMVQVRAAGPFSIPAASAGNWFEIPIDNPYFVYNPSLSLVVETRWTTTPTSTTWLHRTGTHEAVGINRKVQGSDPNASTGTLATTRANFRMRITPSVPDDAGIVSVNAPATPSAPGFNQVEVTLKNYGTALLTSAQINWSVDDVVQTPFAWTGGLSQGDMINLPFSSHNFSAGSHVIKAWASLPNGNPDGFAENDTASRSTVFCLPLAGTVTINAAFAASNPAAGEFKTFNDLAAILNSCGVAGNLVVDVAPNSGPYNEQVVFNSIPFTGPGSTITLNGNGNTISFATAGEDRHVIRLINVNYFTLDSLVIPMLNSPFYGVHIFGTGSNITIKRMNIDMTGQTSTLVQGIVSSGSLTSNLTAGNFSNITYKKNTVTGGGYSVSFMGTAGNTGLLIDSNKLYDYSSHAVYTRGTLGGIISNNTIIKAGGAAGSNAIQLAQSDNASAQVFNNILSHPLTSVGTVTRGIYVFGGGGHKIYNNVIHDIRAETGTVYHALVVRGGAPEVMFNTVKLNHTVAGTANLNGFSEDGTNTQTNLVNNIISIDQATSGTKAAIALASTSTVATTVNSNHNVYWVPGGHIATRSTTTYDLAAWRTASGKDANSIEADPNFAAGTAIPTNGVMNNIGDPSTGIATDITGANRNPNPDPGAYEFTPSMDDASISAFVSPALPVCANTIDVHFNLTNAGSGVLNSVTIQWSVNGVMQTPYQWTGNLASGATETVTIGTATVTGSTVYAFKAYTVSPNGQTDANNSNDTLTFSGFRRGMSGNYTINSAMPSSATNYTGFQAIANDLSLYGVCGPVNIDVTGGTYTEQVSFDSIPGSSSTNVVTLNGNNAELTFNPTVTATDHILRLNNVQHFVVQNLQVISSNASNGRGIFITRGSSDIVLQNNVVEVTKTNSGATAFPIIISGSNYLLDGSLSNNISILNNVVRGGYVGIQISGVNNTPINKVLVSGNILDDQYLYGVQAGAATNLIISKNEIIRSSRSGASGSFYGINLTFRTTNFLVDKNRIHDLQNAAMTLSHLAGGINVDGTNIAPSSGTISNNLIYNLTNTSTQYGINDGTWGTGNSINIFHNTVVLNDEAFAGSATTSAITVSESGRASGAVHTIRNNILYISRGGTGNKQLIEIRDEEFTSNFNVFWLNTATGNVGVGRVGNVTFPDLASWQVNTTQDMNSIVADPQFSNMAGGDFKPMNIMIDASAMNTLSVGVVEDFNDEPRNTNPDPGAIEFSILTYTFIGNGNWDVPANWLGNAMPPSPLPSGSEIIVDPAGTAILNVPFTVAPGGKLRVKSGKIFIVPGNLTIQ